MDSVTKILQNVAVTCSKARTLFDSVIETHPSTANRLACDAKIVLNPDSKSAIVKIQLNNIAKLTRTETESISILKKIEENHTFEADDSTGLSCVAYVSEETRMGQSYTAAYIDPRFLLPTSNLCECLFSKNRLHSK